LRKLIDKRLAEMKREEDRAAAVAPGRPGRRPAKPKDAALTPAQITARILVIIVVRLGHERAARLSGKQEATPMAEWHFDPDHTVAAFAVRHLTIAKVRGQFNKVSGTLTFDPANPAETGLEITVDVASLYTGIGKRDVHLFSPDFFDAVNHPEIIFRGTGSTMSGRRGVLSGELKIRGVGRPASLEIELSEALKLPADFGGETTLGLAARTTINREDFGLLWNLPLADGGVLVGTEVEITLDGEVDLAE
jgi:polyisoprenoid-binding protein YceI